jgi:uncharacterized membrane protein
MAFCANCGAALTQGSGFCGACGKPVTAANPAAPAPVAVSSAGAGSGNTGLSSNVAGALAYILGIITGILFLVLEPYKNDRFVRFHAMQSVLFSVACIVFAIVWGILTGMLLSISGYLWLVTLPVRMLISLGIFGLWLYVMYQAYNQREYRIPIIGTIAAKQLG